MLTKYPVAASHHERGTLGGAFHDCAFGSGMCCSKVLIDPCGRLQQVDARIVACRRRKLAQGLQSKQSVRQVDVVLSPS